jgi:hypothetical protein
MSRMVEIMEALELDDPTPQQRELWSAGLDAMRALGRLEACGRSAFVWQSMQAALFAGLKVELLRLAPPVDE